MISLTELAQLLAPITVDDFPKIQNAPNDSSRITNINRFKLLVEWLLRFDFLHNDIEVLKNSGLYATGNDSLVTGRAEGNEISSKVFVLKNKLTVLGQVLPDLRKQEPQDCVYFKFPQAEDVREIARDLETIQKATLQIILQPGVEGTFKIIRWESGSLWIHVIVGSLTAVSIVGYAAWAAAVVAKKWMEFLIMTRSMESLAIKNESLKDIKDNQKRLLDELVDSEAKALKDKYLSGNNDPELLERVKYTISTFSELIRRGGEVNPALTSPENISNLFPDYKELATIASKIPQLEDASPKEE